MFSVIKVEEITKEFYLSSYIRDISRRIIALSNISFKVYPGEIFCLLGPNGSGKSTLIKILCGLIMPTKGRVLIYGSDPYSQRTMKYIGFIGDNNRNFYSMASGKENLRFFASLYNLSFKETNKRIEVLVELLKMGSYIDRKFYSYSTGMRQRLAIARGMLHDPPILLMDEPMKGLDYETVNYLIKFIKEELILKKKKTVVYATYDSIEAEALECRTALLNKGSLVGCDLFKNLKNKMFNRNEF